MRNFWCLAIYFGCTARFKPALVGNPEDSFFSRFGSTAAHHANVSIWAATWENQQCGFWPGLTQTRLYSHWRWLESGHFVFRKKRYCTVQVAKTKALISFAVTAKLICVFVFAYADCWFSPDAAHIMKNPYIPLLYKKTGVYRVVHYFLIFALKQTGGTRYAPVICIHTTPHPHIYGDGGGRAGLRGANVQGNYFLIVPAV